MLRRYALLLLAMTAFAGSALAQSATCQALRHQLAALTHAGGARAIAYANAAQRQIDEMQRTVAYMRQIGCGTTRFLFFGPTPPPQCAGLSARLSRMQANLASLQGHAEQPGVGAAMAERRDQLMAAISQYCGPEPRPGEPPDQPSLEPDQAASEAPDQPEAPLPDDQEGGIGPGKPVCVRLCDGYFFPLASLGKVGREGAQEMCQAQCPGAETETFALGPDGDITQALGQGGKSYMELDNALRYQKATVPGCSCRKANESWGEALRGAEEMLGGRDAPISAEEAARLSRPSAPSDPKKPAAPAQKQPTAAPTPDTVFGRSPARLAVPGAPLRQGLGADGSRKVRIIAPAPATSP